jgi:hypothetical protein
MSFERFDFENTIEKEEDIYIKKLDKKPMFS